MALTKSVAAVDEWASVTQNTTREGAVVDISAVYASALHIQMALDSATAHTGTEIIVQVSSNTTGDEDWEELMRWVGPTGTSVTENIVDNPLAAGSQAIALADTTGYTVNGEYRFIKDGTIANSEIFFQKDMTPHNGGNGSVTAIDGTTNAHATATPIWSIAKTWAITIPIEFNRVRVVYDNTHDVDGSSVACKCRISKVTAL